MVEGPHLISQTDMMAKLTQPIDLEYITVVFSEPKTGTLKDNPDVKYARVQVSVLNDDRTTSPLIIPTDEQNDGTTSPFRTAYKSAGSPTATMSTVTAFQS